jgi:hypothetical protein
MKTTALFVPVLLCFVVDPAEGAVRLRVSDTVVGPVAIAPGAAANPREIQVHGEGDGRLNTETASLRLTLTSTQTWVRPTAASPRPCALREGQCIPVQFAFST